jgi:two-component system nitrogen regulation sensor histidine kinase NtrY
MNVQASGLRLQAPGASRRIRCFARSPLAWVGVLLPSRRVSLDDDDARERLAGLGEIAAEIAHELRNVLQVISASAYLAREETTKGRASAAVPHVAAIERSAHIAHGIVDDLMGLARGDALHTEPWPLAELALQARGDFAPRAAEWNDVIEPHDLRVRGHRRLLVRLLQVLYDNSVQAGAPRAPRIVTRAFAARSRVVIDVADDGPGVPEHLAAQVFQPLVSARPGGTGLGLALARRIAAAHGGALALVPGGSGATFRLELPVG